MEIELARLFMSNMLGTGESACAGPAGRREVLVAVAASCAFLIVPVNVKSACLYIVTNVESAVYISRIRERGIPLEEWGQFPSASAPPFCANHDLDTK